MGNREIHTNQVLLHFMHEYAKRITRRWELIHANSLSFNSFFSFPRIEYDEIPQKQFSMM